MKLIRVAIDDKEYNALQKFDQTFLYKNDRKSVIEPICLVGENGSGKSNFIELISELFSIVEIDLRRLDRERDGESRIKPKFTLDKKILLEYLLFDEDENTIHVRIDSFKGKWEISKLLDNTFHIIPKDDIDQIKALMPNYIVGYSSGENESISYWFSEVEKEYSDEVQRAADSQSNRKPADPRMFYLNYDTNAAIVISNYLYNGAENLSLFKEVLRIDDVKSFRIYLNFKYKSSYIRLSKEHIQLINKFKRCSTTNDIKYGKVEFKSLKKKIDQPISCIFDFYVTKETKKAFKNEFLTALDLYISLRKFELLNSLKLPSSHRKSSGKKDVLHRPPTVGYDERVFRLDDIKLKIKDPDITIPYIGISDGQHQYLQTIGTILLFEERNILYLLDEPETHFNPQWRSQFVNTLHKETKDRFQEIVLTTHSPYVVSDCEKYNVFVFQRKGSNVEFDNIDIETYGTSFDNLLKRTFNLKYTISQKAFDEIQELLKSSDSEKIKERLDEMGPSFEKLPLLKRLKELEPNS